MDKQKETSVPLECLWEKLLGQYKERSYEESTIKLHEQLVGMLQKRIRQSGNSGYNPSFGSEYLEAQKARVSSGEISQLTYSLYRTLIRRLDDCYYDRGFTIRMSAEPKALPDGYGRCLKGFLDHCAGNGNRQGTLRNKRDCCHRFLTNLIELGCIDIQHMDGNVVCRAVLMEKNKNFWTVISQFLRYISNSGIVEKDYSPLVPRYRAGNKLPSVYSREDIASVESSIDRSTLQGKRDYAMVLLATRLGMRRSDIARLAMDDIDYEKKQIGFTQLKTGVPIVLPLLPEIEDALRDYTGALRRQPGDAPVFMRTKAPYQGIGPQLLRNVAVRCLGTAGIDTAGKKRGPHSFRASFATAMVNDGIPFDSVGKALGHRDPDMLRHYARLDIGNLRKCAIAAQPPAGFFKKFLEGRAGIDGTCF